MIAATKPWLRASEAAALAGCSRVTLWRWIVSGAIPDSALMKCGKKQYRVARAWVEGHAVGIAIPDRWTGPVAAKLPGARS